MKTPPPPRRPTELHPAARANGAERSRLVRGLFSGIAPRYDLVNRVASAGVDVGWRRRTVSALSLAPGDWVLDACCGTADLSAALAAAGARVLGVDFCRPMLDGAQRKLNASTPLLEADAMRVPLPDASVDLITVAFGFRNLANYSNALAELTRLLVPGGQLAILEFSQPTLPGFAQVFEFYFREILPRIGNAVSGAGDAYSYLQRSVDRFLTPEELGVAMQQSGLRDVYFERLTFGVSCLHVGRRK